MLDHLRFVSTGAGSRPGTPATDSSGPYVPDRSLPRQGGPSPTLQRVLGGGLCSGCGACAAVAPASVSLTLTREGFIRPVQSHPLSPESEALLARTCPGLGQRVEAGGRSDHPLWGPYLGVRAGWATDPAIRHRASSGGALTAVLVHLLASGTVDAVLQTAADPDRPVANRTVVCRSPAEVMDCAGSRYAPSSPLDGVAAAVASGLRYAFVGKPCDAAALRAMGEDDAQIRRTFPVVLSFFCAGVPSLSGAVRLLARMGVEEKDVATFRYRGNGWPGHATARLHDGRERRTSYQESWGEVLSKRVQHRCKLCADGTGAAADLVFADAWETDARGYPVFEDREGVSLILARTGEGAALLTRAEAAGAVETGPYDIRRIAGIQPGQRERKRAVLARLLALRALGRPAPSYRGLQLWRAALQNGPGRNLRNFLGTARRALWTRR